VGETPYYKHGTSPDVELKLCLRAIVAACQDAGLSPSDVDGFVSYGSERNTGARLVPALGTKELRFNGLLWSHGGGIPGAVGLAAAAIATGQAEAVVVYRAMEESASGRLRVAVHQHDTSAQLLLNGIDSPMQGCALRTERMLEVDGVPRSTMFATAMASYYHANRNPRAAGHDVVLTKELYESSRLVAEPYHLFDCSRESDGAAAVLLVAAERADDFPHKPAYVLSAPTGIEGRWGGAVEENCDPFGSAGFAAVSRRLWAESGYGPGDMDVAQIYDNATGLGVAAIIDHGFCTKEEAGTFITFENLIAPNGKLPINTSGGNLAEGFIHGMSLVNEAVRQIRGTSTNQVPDASLSVMTGGPGDHIVSSAVLGSASTL
jgi:acetyl-CoA acetyltransferase